MNRSLTTCLLGLIALAVPSHAANWAKPTAPAVPGTDGYVAIPNAAVMPQKTRVYQAVFDATRFADDPGAVVPALNMAGSELNLLVACGVPRNNAKFVVVFHGPAVDGLLDNEHYRARYHRTNPNLPVLRDLKRAGVKLYVCGQHLAAADIDPATLTPDVQVASDALIVLMVFQGDGYALMSF
jgi:intracellular sulfur oxidation DsrE/DsrF family protein